MYGEMNALKLNIPKREASIAKKVEKRLHRRSARNGRTKRKGLLSDSSDDEFICSKSSNTRKLRRSARTAVLPQLESSESSDDEPIPLSKAHEAVSQREYITEKEPSSANNCKQLRESEDFSGSDSKSRDYNSWLKSNGEVSRELELCGPTEKVVSSSDSDDELITIKKSRSNLIVEKSSESVNNSDNLSLANQKISIASMSPSECDDEPIYISRKPTKPRVSLKKRSIKKAVRKKKRSTKKKATNKKVYNMPGQKKDTPSELNGARIFYESLRKEIPHSKMAEGYLLKFGLLSYDEAEALVEEQSR